MPSEVDDCVRVAVGEREECAREEDRGYRDCDDWEDEGYNECCDWWPCSWACDAWVWVSHWVCVAYVWIADLVCVAWVTITEYACVVFAVVEEVLTPLVSAVTGPSHISDSNLDRGVGGVAKTYTDSRSFAAPIDYESVFDRFNYRDGGKYLQFKIDGDDVTWNDAYPAGNFRLFAPASQVFNSPSDLEGSALTVSYDDKRLGEWSEAPTFEMIVASSDRVFAKERGVDSFYLAVPTHLYLHKTSGGERIVLPQSFFKNDPELGSPDARLEDLLFHVAIDGDDERHLATERFPLYRALFRLMESPLRNVESFRNLFAMMDAQVPPLTWVRLDTRPARGSKPVPPAFPSYKHVTYKKDGLFGLFSSEDDKFSIDFEHVLDIGVGLSHLNEQYEPIYGGELDILDKNPGFPGMTDEEIYRLLNGPIQDIGGWVDGTCIYYLLVRLPFVDSDDADRLADQLARHDETETDNEFFARRYAVLWLDEQHSPTERWRALDVSETEYEVPFGKPIISVVDTAPELDFSPARFVNPFTEGFIRSFSRMAVARQVVIVNGFDKRKDCPGKHRLYSTHFTWPTMDRTWRFRDLPDGPSVRLLPDDSPELACEGHIEPTAESVYPQTLRLREDMTIHVRGALEVNGELMVGRWAQKYLPADNGEVPSAGTVRDGSAGERDAGYAHPWQFYEERIFLKMHQMYSHFGVYECVNSRCQFYKIGILSHEKVEIEDIPDLVWIDKKKALKIDRCEVNWAAAAAVIDMALAAIVVSALVAAAIGIVTNVVTGLAAFVAFILVELGISAFFILEKKTFPSLYEQSLRFKIVETASMGHLMFYFDKREDKTYKFDGLPIEHLSLTEDGKNGATVRVSVDEFVRSERSIGVRELISPPEVAEATVIVRVRQDRPRGVEFRFTSARSAADFGDSEQEFEDWIELNIDRMKLGIPESANGSNIIFETRREDSIVRVDNSTNEFSCEWTPEPSDPYYRDLVSLLTEHGKITSGVSLWFVSITGQVNIAGRLRFDRVDV